MNLTVLCSFDPKSGWRVFRILKIESKSIAVVEQKGRKLLSIPIVTGCRRGQFCNPMKLLRKVIEVHAMPIRLGSVTHVLDFITQEDHQEEIKNEDIQRLASARKRIPVQGRSTQLH